MKKLGERKYPVDKLAVISAVALSVNQAAAGSLTVSAKELQYDGTTQMATEDYMLDADRFASELVIEEVYVQAGTDLEAGDRILKLTSESYQEALDYYEAAVIRADNELTDTKREYDQGVLEVKYDYEKAKTEAEQAEFIREYQQEELERTIADYEEIQTEISERIEELENGSYGSTSGGGMSGGSASGGGSGSGGLTNDKSEKESSKQKNGSGTENGAPVTESETGRFPGETQSAAESETTPGTESDATHETDLVPEGTTPGTESDAMHETDQVPGETMPGTESDAMHETDQVPGETMPGTESDATHETDQVPGETMSGTEPETDAIHETEVPGETMPGTEPETATGTEPGAGETAPDASTDAEQQIRQLKKQIEAASQSCDALLEQIAMLLEGLADGDENGEREASTETQAGSGSLQSELQISVDGDMVIQEYMKELQEKAEDIPQDLVLLAVMAGIDCEKYTALLDECIIQMETDLAAQQSVLERLAEIESQGNVDPGEEAAEIDADRMKVLLDQLETAMQEENSLYQQLLSLEEEQLADDQELAGIQNGEQQGNHGNMQTPSSEQPEQSESHQNTDMTDRTAGLSDQSDQTNSAPMSSGAASGSNSSRSSGAASGSSFPMSSGSASGRSMGASGGLPEADTGTAGSSVSMADLHLTEQDISLFGNTYDLSQVKAMLEREPSDSDSALELAEQLEDALDTVKEQYGELVRNKKAEELKIQYTCDMAVLSGRLAEVTYEQELQEWQDTLAAAQESKTDLEEKKQMLEAMADGIVTAAAGGMVAAVNYEAGEVLTSTTPLLSFYDTDEVTVTLAVPQEEIALLDVGETVEAVLSGMYSQTGTIAGKSLAAQEGNARTNVNYEVTVSIGNADGRLQAGTAVSVIINTAEEDIPEDGDSGDIQSAETETQTGEGQNE